ncbi:enoyl-CoA hydratase [Muribacter muris]|uniref:Enoyl-CoA hydratase n=1 Tax=Muribacter muris TaxID=67855 RepID=A0A4Y9JX68_9PAST|nr:enoyl-CoA hydratase [Muribacter muris]MBF0785417.1 enoyl-CoA hydratase [Muribacter muris]MBF0828065.1 enoyl-CoA hydratase [Muribacter muris]TFV09549.1 enoyl-CoA hydratase [Muribacter muris]
MAIYLALYKGKGDWVDRLVRFFTKGKYSHCEIAIERHQFQSGDYYPIISYECYSASPRDNGVRCKKINLTDRLTWELIELEGITESQIKAYFERTKGKQYDLWGAIGVVLGFKQKRDKFFCSEWCFNALRNSDQGWRFSPNQLAIIFGGRQ